MSTSSYPQTFIVSNDRPWWSFLPRRTAPKSHRLRRFRLNKPLYGYPQVSHLCSETWVLL